MKKTIIAVTINPAIDLTRIGCKEIVSAGGKGINTARALQNLGLRTVATGFLGGATGSYFKKLLNQDKIKYNFLKIKEATRANWTFLDHGRDGHRRRIYKGPEVSPKELKNFREHLDNLLDNASFVIFSGRKNRGLTDTDYAGLVQIARRKRLPVILDITGRALWMGLKERPLLVKVNLSEAEEALKFKLDTNIRIKKAARTFRNQGAQYVIISCGKRGAVGSDGSGVWLAQAPDIKESNSVGSGDSMVAGFLYAYTQHKTFLEALVMAVAAGTANAENIIPGQIKKKRFLQLAPKVKIKKL